MKKNLPIAESCSLLLPQHCDLIDWIKDGRKLLTGTESSKYVRRCSHTLREWRNRKSFGVVWIQAVAYWLRDIGKGLFSRSLCFLFTRLVWGWSGHQQCRYASLIPQPPEAQTSYFFCFPEVSQWTQEASYQVCCNQPCPCLKGIRDQTAAASEEGRCRRLLEAGLVENSSSKHHEASSFP